MKICNKCNLPKPLTEFYVDANMADGYFSKCKACCAAYKKKYRKKNLKAIRKKGREYYHGHKTEAQQYREDNKQAIKENKQQYYKDNKSEFQKRSGKYYKQNRKAIIKKNVAYRKEREKQDSAYKFKNNVRSLIRETFKNNSFKKAAKTETILGCTITEFRQYIESKFEPWMNWDNYGTYTGEYKSGWDLDHIIPIDTAKTELDVIRLNHYTNFQPLCSRINRNEKRNRAE